MIFCHEKKGLFIMKVSSVQKQYPSKNFTSRVPYVVNTEKRLWQHGLTCEFNDSALVGRCIEKTTKLFKQVFDQKALPKTVAFVPLAGLEYGKYDHAEDSVSINSTLPCFKSEEELRKKTEGAKRIFFLPNRASSTHYLAPFIHQFGHCAHAHHLKENGNTLSYSILSRMKVPNAIGRLITRFKLGDIAAENMDDFMAERIVKDMGKNFDHDAMYDEKFIGDKNNLKYDDIFQRKWNCRYISPQSYIDYYTQQVWNGNIEGAKDVVKDIESLLDAYAQGKVLYVKEEERLVAAAELKRKSLIGVLDYVFGSIFETPKIVDRFNELKIPQKLQRM